MSEQGRRKSIKELVESGEYVLRPGEYLSPAGVLMGHNASRGIPRFGADESFGLYGEGTHPDGGQYSPADMTMYDRQRAGS